MDKNELKPQTPTPKDTPPEPAELPESWRRFYEEVRKMVIDDHKEKE